MVCHSVTEASGGSAYVLNLTCNAGNNVNNKLSMTINQLRFNEKLLEHEIMVSLLRDYKWST